MERNEINFGLLKIHRNEFHSVEECFCLAFGFSFGGCVLGLTVASLLILLLFYFPMETCELNWHSVYIDCNSVKLQQMRCGLYAYWVREKVGKSENKMFLLRIDVNWRRECERNENWEELMLSKQRESKFVQIQRKFRISAFTQCLLCNWMVCG